MKNSSIPIILFALLLQISAMAQDTRQVVTDLNTLSAGFKTPDSSFGPSVLWGWDGPMTKEVIIRDLDRFKSLNIRSVNIEAGYDLPEQYLSEGYFELIKFAVEQAKERGMVIWMIDESKYPSGFAGGKFSKERPDLRMQGLDIYKKIDLVSGETYSAEIPPAVMSAIAVNKESGQSRLLKIENAKLNWTAPEGNWQILQVRHKFRTSVTRAGNNPTHGKDTLNSLCDYLNPVAVHQFIEFTHEQYKKHIGKEFGKTFLGFRGDEPDYGFMPWTPALPEEFMMKKGYDVRPWVSAFFVKNPTDSMLRVKADYWDVWSDMFGENFFKVQADWCAANQLSYMVHLNHEDKMMALAQSSGDFFENLRHVQIPGIDAIWNQIWPGTIADFPKYASSVAHVYGKRKAMSESFAAYRTPPTVDQAKWVTDQQFARGINLFEWMYWPASTRSDGTPKGWFGDAKFPQVALYTNRVSYLLSNGKPAANIAVYYPTESEWLGDQKADSSALELCRMLLGNQHDFDFIDDYAITKVLAQKGNGLQNLSGQIYQTILIPSVTAMPKAVLDKLKEFVAGGGKVIFTSKKPSFIVEQSFRNAGENYDFNWAISETVKQLFQYLPIPDFKLAKSFPAIKYNHRKFTDGDLYFIFNEGDTAVETDVTLSGEGKTHSWDPISGQSHDIEQIGQVENLVKLKLSIKPWETKIIVISNQKTIKQKQ
ncbi:MAG TPA: glycosyl hydrolase [Prolixibacteraceae bacterium]|nr:glycosyl hydrolase [Prolixibacteraceae bacterium]